MKKIGIIHEREQFDPDFKSLFDLLRKGDRPNGALVSIVIVMKKL